MTELAFDCALFAANELPVLFQRESCGNVHWLTANQMLQQKAPLEVQMDSALFF